MRKAKVVEKASKGLQKVSQARPSLWLRPHMGQRFARERKCTSIIHLTDVVAGHGCRPWLVQLLRALQ